MHESNFNPTKTPKPKPDKCLNESFNKTIKEQKIVVERVAIPKARLAKASPEAVADCILKVFLITRLQPRMD